MNNKASPPSTNPTKKCRTLFPYFPSLEGRLAGEHTVYIIQETTKQRKTENTEAENCILTCFV
jgi:hypothetical protein